MRKGLQGMIPALLTRIDTYKIIHGLKKPQVVNIFLKSGKKEVRSFTHLTQFFSGYISSFSDFFPKKSLIRWC